MGTQQGIAAKKAWGCIVLIKIMSFPEAHFSEACELVPILNELVDLASLDGKFLQESLSRKKKVDAFTSKFLDIHSKILELNNEEKLTRSLRPTGNT